MKFALIRISTTITNKKNDKQSERKTSIKNKAKNTYIVNNRDFTAYKMLF